MRKQTLFNDGWLFEMPGNEAVEVCLPHTWNGIDGQDGGDDYKRLPCKYTKKFAKPELADGEKCLIVFRAVNSEADVSINGKHVLRHEGGYSKFIVDITDDLQDENVLEVIADNTPNETVYPQKADFTFYGGIYRDVTMEILPKNRFAYREFAAPSIKAYPTVEGSNGELIVSVNVEGEGDVEIKVLDAEGNVVACGKPDEKIIIENVHLWNSVKDPYLYTVKAALSVDGAVVDETEANIGFRTFKVDADKGFILNGEVYPLRGVCRHQDRPKIGNAISKAEHEEDIALIKEIGANTIRLAHYQHDDYFYDLCDKEGFVVWAEIPYISKHMPTANANTESQMNELIAQLFNHPCIVVWGISNEITIVNKNQADMVENHKRLNELCHKLDPSRLTTVACYAMCGHTNKSAHITDIVSWNLYLGWYTPFMWLNRVWFWLFRLLYPKRPIGMSEYGAEAMTNLHSVSPRRGDNTEEYQAVYHEYMAKFFDERKYFWATHIWNMFDFAADARDQGGEPGMNHKGLITFDRKTKKDSFYLYKAYWSDEPFVHLCGSRFVNRTGSKIEVKIYSNQKEVTLYNNGKEIGTKSGDKIFKFTIPMEEENEIEVKCGDLSDKITVKHVATPDPQYVLQKNASSGTTSWEK
ncbi:MAG: glycoside hydrolase family 2 protein [Clostridia bacterium]|nr:glycoside hydrolase family 2 protein [Clostridia bacterium]